MTLNQRKEMQITPVYLCLNFSNSVLRLSKTGTLAQGEILFANHPRTYSELEFANILTMLHIQKVKTTDDIVVESKLYTKARIKNAGKILASFTNDLSECEIFALKKTYENEYLKKIRKELLLVLAKVDENNRSIIYLKTTFNIKGKGYTLFPFFSSSDKCEKYCLENAKITNGYKPLATTIDKMLPIIMSDEGIFINPNENEILGKDVGLAFLSSILKRK